MPAARATAVIAKASQSHGSAASSSAVTARRAGLLAASPSAKRPRHPPAAVAPRKRRRRVRTPARSSTASADITATARCIQDGQGPVRPSKANAGSHPDLSVQKSTSSVP